MIVSKEEWKKKMDNLQIWRKNRKNKLNTNINKNPYKEWVDRVKLGKTVLDIGCGAKSIENVLPKDIKYVGIDPFPIVENVVKMSIEECTFDDRSFDTVFVLAVLDGVYDLEKSLEQINRIANTNIVIITGLDIEVDKCHTQYIKLEDILNGLKDFEIKYKEMIHTKTWLFDFWRK